MAVYIKGMEMPCACIFCELYDGDLYWCRGAKREVPYSPEDKRAKFCPLVPVPPHYDLIDHNALKIAVMNCDCETRVDFLKHTMDCINKAPVVISSDMPTYEAEEGE